MYPNSLPIYDEKMCTFFALGRNAMYAACQILGLKKGDEILTPAFDCDGSLQPFRALGCGLRFYRSDAYTFKVDISDIERQITSTTKVIHIINHFGLPQPWNELLRLKDKTNIPILEDNAYSLFSRIDGKPFGTFGDMSIFSLRKNLYLVDGGLLRINNPKYTFELKFKGIPFIYWAEARNFLHSAGAALGLTGREPPPLYSDDKEGYPVWPLRDIVGKEFSCNYLRPMSKLAEIQLKKFSADDYADICVKKKQFYAYLAGELGKIKGIKVLWPVLPEGIVPFCLSFLVEEKRDVFLGLLKKKYDVMAWPTLSQQIINQLEKFPEVELLGRRLLQFNLLAQKIRQPKFFHYLQKFVQDIRKLCDKYL